MERVREQPKTGTSQMASKQEAWPNEEGRPRQGSFIDTDMEFVEQFEWPTMEAVSFALKAVLQFRW